MTKAFVIEGKMKTEGNGGLMAVAGVLFAYAEPTLATFEALGFQRNGSVSKAEPVTAVDYWPADPTFYYFNPRCPDFVTKLTLTKKMTGVKDRVTHTTARTRRPYNEMIPKITGLAAVRIGLAPANGALGVTDFPLKAQAITRQSKRQPVFAR